MPSRKAQPPKGYDARGSFDSKRNRVYRNDGDDSKGEGLMAYDNPAEVWDTSLHA